MCTHLIQLNNCNILLNHISSNIRKELDAVQDLSANQTPWSCRVQQPISKLNRGSYLLRTKTWTLNHIDQIKVLMLLFVGQLLKCTAVFFIHSKLHDQISMQLISSFLHESPRLTTMRGSCTRYTYQTMVAKMFWLACQSITQVKVLQFRQLICADSLAVNFSLFRPNTPKLLRLNSPVPNKRQGFFGCFSKVLGTRNDALSKKIFSFYFHTSVYLILF